MDTRGPDRRDHGRLRRGTAPRRGVARLRQGHGHLDQAGGDGGLADGEPLGVRGARCGRARGGLERLRRRRHARQDRGDPHQRPRLRDRRRETLPRPRHDLLRALDLQVRGGCSSGGRRGDHHPRQRACRVSLGHRAEQLDGAATRHRLTGRQRRAHRHRGLGHPRRGRGAAAGERAELHGSRAGGEPAGLQAHRTAPTRGWPLAQRDPACVLIQCVGDDPRQQAPQGGRRLHGALGPPRTLPGPQRRQHLQRRARQCERYGGVVGDRESLRRVTASAGTLGGVPRAHPRGERAAWIGLLRRQPGVPAAPDGCCPQHGRVVLGWADARCVGDRPRSLRARGVSGRGRQDPGPRPARGADAGEGVLLPIG